MADVLFIHPGDHKKTYQDLSKEFTAIATPAWSSLVADYIRRKGYKAAIYDVNVEGWQDNTCEELIAKYSPSLIVMMVYGHNPSASTQTMPAAGKIARDIKNYNRDIPLAMGGIHPSALPEKTLNEEAVDFVIQGEGPYTIEGLLGYIKGAGPIQNVKGLWFKDGGKINFTQPAALIQDLDGELSGYAWDLLPDLSNYRAHNMHCFQYFEESRRDDFLDVRSPYVALNTSLGCPYSCHYCCINAIFSKPGIRNWSVNKVISWIDILVNKYKIKNIRFDDELFILSSQRIEQFCDAVIERNYDLNLWVYGRVDTIKEVLLKKLKKAGVSWICLGIESANVRVRDSVHKSFYNNVRETVKIIQDSGIYVLGNYMFGLPEDDLNTMQETFDLAVELNCEFINFCSVMAYPGSKLYDRALNERIILPDSWDGFSQHSYNTLPLSTNYLPAAEVLKFRDDMFYKYFTNPKYLDMMRDKFGEKTVNHLKKMTEIRIKRKL